MKSMVIKFKNGSSIEALPTEYSAVRSDVKYIFPRANNKPAMTMIQFLEMEMYLLDLFYGGDCDD